MFLIRLANPRSRNGREYDVYVLCDELSNPVIFDDHDVLQRTIRSSRFRRSITSLYSAEIAPVALENGTCGLEVFTLRELNRAAERLPV